MRIGQVQFNIVELIRWGSISNGLKAAAKYIVEWYPIGERCVHDSGQGPHFFHYLLVKAHNIRIALVFSARKRNSYNNPMVSIKTQSHMLQPLEAAHQQACSGQQHHGTNDFSYHKALAQATAFYVNCGSGRGAPQ